MLIIGIFKKLCLPSVGGVHVLIALLSNSFLTNIIFRNI